MRTPITAIEIYNIGTSLEYALTKTEKHNTIYTARCIEDKEKFDASFCAPSNYSKEQLKEIGKEIASGWGAECISIKRELTEQEKFEKASEKWKYLCGTKYGRKCEFNREIYMLVGLKGRRTLVFAKDLAETTRYEFKLPSRIPDYCMPTLRWIAEEV